MANFIVHAYQACYNYEVDSNNECWIYKGDIDPSTGYGRVMIDGIRYGVHRLVAVLYHGLDLNNPEQFACHTCTNRNCISPHHIYVGNNKSNQLDAVDDLCKRGHPLVGENVYYMKRKNGSTFRNCRICSQKRALESYHRRKAARLPKRTEG